VSLSIVLINENENIEAAKSGENMARAAARRRGSRSEHRLAKWRKWRKAENLKIRRPSAGVAGWRGGWLCGGWLCCQLSASWLSLMCQLNGGSARINIWWRLAANGWRLKMAGIEAIIHRNGLSWLASSQMWHLSSAQRPHRNKLRRAAASKMSARLSVVANAKHREMEISRRPAQC
jgi:hypothetical protein